MLASVIIVNYNTFEITCNCIDSVIRFTKGVDYEIILVDNASTKDNPDDFLRRFPGIKLIKSPVNGGFAKGNNLGIQHASGDIILLLNSDTWLNEDSISIAARYTANHNEIGPLTVRLVYPDGRLQHYVRAFRSIGNELLDLVRPLLYLLPYKIRARKMLNQYFNSDFDTYCDWVSGAFMMFRKSLLDELPGKKLDERFFMYGEDQLWCYQFKQAGYRSFFLAATTVVHIASASTSADKRLQLHKTLIQHELEIMKYRKGNSLYYSVFRSLFLLKQNTAYFIRTLLSKADIKA